MSDWPKVSLGDVITHRKEFIIIDDTLEYKRCRVQSHSKGIVQRDFVTGAEVKTKKQQECHAGELLVAEIDAKVGGYGIVPDELKGAIVSSHYFLFTINENKIDRGFLDYFIRTPSFFEQVDARGSTNYAAIRPEHVLSYKIPLPQLSEQHQIVEKLNFISEKSISVQEIQKQIQQTEYALLLSMFSDIKKESKWFLMKDVAPIVRRPVQIDTTSLYPELGIRSFGKGTFHKPAVPGSEVGTKKLYQIKAGDLMFSNVFAWEGAIAVAQDEDDGRYGSHRFISCVPNPEIAILGFLCFYFLTGEGMQKIGEASPGGAGRNRTLGLTKLENIQVPLPSLKQQTRFMQLRNKILAADSHRADTQAKLELLLISSIDKAFKGEL